MLGINFIKNELVFMGKDVDRDSEIWAGYLCVSGEGLYVVFFYVGFSALFVFRR